ncbi:MAG: hypothetical protein IPL65_01800 [Lewinellaceae bacterium]|nr:hypothetical protein [Lewinellaceae bacterium]
MTLYKFCWYADWLILLIALFFFFSGMSTATPGSGFMKTWAVLLLVLFAIPIGSYLLHANGFTGFATFIAAFPAGAGLLYLLFMVVVLVSGARWN